MELGTIPRPRSTEFLTFRLFSIWRMQGTLLTSARLTETTTPERDINQKTPAILGAAWIGQKKIDQEYYVAALCRTSLHNKFGVSPQARKGCASFESHQMKYYTHRARSRTLQKSHHGICHDTKITNWSACGALKKRGRRNADWHILQIKCLHTQVHQLEIQYSSPQPIALMVTPQFPFRRGKQYLEMRSFPSTFPPKILEFLAEAFVCTISLVNSPVSACSTSRRVYFILCPCAASYDIVS